jgi:hypothetical protein
MGLMDKAKFWKKDEEDIGDLSGLGDFGLEEHGHPPGAETAGLGGEGLGDLPPLTEPEKPGMQTGVPTHMEDVKPTQGSMDMGDQFGLKPAPPEHSAPGAPPGAPPFQAVRAPDMGDLAKDIEIIHAKLDAIKSSLDSVNQRLATLERIASGDSKTRYTW